MLTARSRQLLKPVLGQQNKLHSANLLRATLGSQYRYFTAPSSDTKSPVIDFRDASSVYESKSSYELLRALFVLGSCQIKPLVANADFVYRLSKKVLGNTLVDGVVRHTFFAHFCAGENESEIKPTVERLRQNGVGSILDYAAENDDAGVDEPEVKIEEDPELAMAHLQTQLIEESSDMDFCRKYHYEGEDACDEHVKVFLKCIESVHNVTPGGFAAIKLTALGPPQLLRRVSTAINEIRNLFDKFDSEEKDGVLTRDEFISGYTRYFDDVPSVDGVDLDPFSLDGMLAHLDPHNKGIIDYEEWTNLIQLDHLGALTSRCRESGPLAQSVLTDWEIQAAFAMSERIDKLAQRASELNVCLMIDAEQSYFQPAIDNTVFALQRKYNSLDGVDGRESQVTIYNTYQCYLKDSLIRMEQDLKRSRRDRYHFGAKLVRGAYMVSERELAAEQNVKSPVHETLEETHKSYDAAIDMLLKSIADGERTRFMVASHNEKSVKYTVQRLNELGLDPDCGVQFGQLLGMSDHLTLQLGQNGYHAYKYVPYGAVHEVIPYLLRRAQENSSLLGVARTEMKLMGSELLRRASPF